MKKKIILGLFVLSILTVARDNMNLDRKLDIMTKKLELTSEQRSEVKKDIENMHKEKKELWEKIEPEFKNILNLEQQKAYDEFKTTKKKPEKKSMKFTDAQKEQKKELMKKHKPEFEAIHKKFMSGVKEDLTAEQYTKLDNMHKNMKDKMKKMHGKKNK